MHSKLNDVKKILSTNSLLKSKNTEQKNRRNRFKTNFDSICFEKKVTKFDFKVS
jgi:hypothetical protein